MPVFIPNPDLKYYEKKKKNYDKEKEVCEIYARVDVGTEDVYDTVRKRYEESKAGTGDESE